MDTLEYIYGFKSEYLLSTYCLSNLLRCAFQDKNKFNNVSGTKDTMIMKKNCFDYLLKEIDILEPTLIIAQGEWAININLIQKIENYYNEKCKVLKMNSNGKYGLYQFNKFFCITSHHPAIYGNWKKNLAPDSLWPMIDYLKDNNLIPKVECIQKENFELLVKEKINDKLSGLESNDLLRNSKQLKLF